MPAESLWRQVYDAVRADIFSGRYPPGSRLPSEPALMAAHGAGSRDTIRRAVAELAGEGLIGEGRRVIERRPITLRVSDEESLTFIADLAAAGHVAAAPLIEVELEDDWLVRKVLRVVDGEPHNYAEWRFPLSLAQGTALAYRADIARGSVAYVKEGLGCADLMQDKWIEVRPATPEEAVILRPPPGWNVIAEHRAGTQDGKAVFSSVRILRADRTRLIP